MKKLLAILLLFVPFTISAKSYQFDDVKVNMPEDWYVFTKDNIKDNSDLKLLGVEEEYMEQLFSDSMYKMDAILFTNNDSSVEMFVLEKKVTSPNFNSFSIKELSPVKDEYKKIVNTDNVEVIETNKNKYVKAIYNDSGLNVVDYYTVYNNIGYTLKFQTVEEIDDDYLNYFDLIMDKVDFPKSVISSNTKSDELDEEGIAYRIGYSAARGAVIGAIVGAIIYGIRKKKNS